MKKQKTTLKMIVALAMLSAISIICGKYLGINAGEFMRFSLENMPIILAGMAFGPLAGGAVGLVADLVGCVMVGWVPIPWVSVGACLIGVVAGLTRLMLKKTALPTPIITVITVVAAHFVGSVLIKTIGLAAVYSMPYPLLMLWRLLNYAIVGTIDGIIVHVLLNNKGIKQQIKEIGGKEI